MRRLSIAVLAACRAPTAAPPAIANHAEPPAIAQRLRPLVVDELATCTQPHHLAIALDGAPVASVTLTCPPPLPPPRPNQVVVTTDGAPRTFDGPAIAVGAGHHVISVRDDVTGFTATVAGDFPVYGNAEHPKPRGQGPLADVVVVLDHVDGIRATVDVRALLIFL